MCVEKPLTTNEVENSCANVFAWQGTKNTMKYFNFSDKYAQSNRKYIRPGYNKSAGIGKCPTRRCPKHSSLLYENFLDKYVKYISQILGQAITRVLKCGCARLEDTLSFLLLYIIKEERYIRALFCASSSLCSMLC